MYYESKKGAGMPSNIGTSVLYVLCKLWFHTQFNCGLRQYRQLFSKAQEKDIGRICNTYCI